MKKILAMVLAVALVLALAAGCSGGKDSDTVYIGVYEPQSGANGAGGKQEILGMEYANSLTPTVEIGGKEYKVELVYADNESSTDKAVSAATKLVSVGCSVVLGSYGSSVAIAASDTFKEAGIPAIGVTCTNPQITEGNEHYFRICFLDPFQGTVLANFAYEELGAQTVYCLGELGNDYDQGLVNYFQKAGEALGMKIITAEFPKDTSDFTSYLTSAKNEGADVIFAPTSISYGQLIVDQAVSQGVGAALVASDTWDSNKILEAAAGKDVAIYVSTFYAEGGDASFEEGFKKWLGENSDKLANNGGNDMIAAVSVMGYDAYYTALEALRAAGSTDAGKVMQALPDVTHTGVTGAIAFDDVGDAVRDSAYIKSANTDTVAWDFVAEQSVQ